MLGILALELLLDLWITLAPEGFQVGGDLDGAMVWREDLDPKGDAAAADGETARSVILILDPRGDGRRRAVLGITDFRGAAAGQLDAFRGEIIEGLLLRTVQPRLHDRPDRALLDFLIADCSLANLLEEQLLCAFVDPWEFQFRKFTRDEIHPGDPLFDRVVPVFERTSPGQDFAGEELRRSGIVRSGKFFAPQDEIVKERRATGDDAPQRRIEFYAVFFAKRFRE